LDEEAADEVAPRGKKIDADVAARWASVPRFLLLEAAVDENIMMDRML
jgi:hypothetical protein